MESFKVANGVPTGAPFAFRRPPLPIGWPNLDPLPKGTNMPVDDAPAVDQPTELEASQPPESEQGNDRECSAAAGSLWKEPEKNFLTMLRHKRRTDEGFCRAMDAEQAAYRKQLAARPRPRRAPRRLVASAATSFARRRSHSPSRPRTRRAPRRVSPSRGDPDPGGDTEPPPSAQGRGEDVARNLRVLGRAAPTAVAVVEQPMRGSHARSDER